MNIKGLDGRWLDPLRWLEYLTLWTKSLDVSAQDGNSITKWFRAGGRGRNVKIWRKWVIIFCQDVFADDGRWIRLPHVAPEARGHTVGSCSSVVGLQCATREMVNWTTPSLSDWVFLQWLPRQPSCHASSLSAEMLLPFFDNGQQWLNVWDYWEFGLRHHFFMMMSETEQETAEQQCHLVLLLWTAPTLTGGFTHSHCYLWWIWSR